MRGIHINTDTTSHVVNRRQIPLLDVLTCSRVINELSQQGTLLNGVCLQSRTVWVDVAQDKTVTVTNAGTLKPSRMRIDAVATLNHLVSTVAIDISHAQLMEFSRPGSLVVAAPCVGMMPVGRCASSPVVVPSKHIVMMSLVVVAIETLHDQRGVDAVKIADGEMTLHSRIAIAHIVRTAGAGVTVNAVRDLVVFQFVAGNLCTCGSVDD